MARLHGVIGAFLAALAVGFYIAGFASHGTYEFDQHGGVTASFRESVVATPDTLGPYSLCYIGYYDSACHIPNPKCTIAITTTINTIQQDLTLPACGKYNAYRAFILIAFACSTLGLIVMIYTTCQTGAWTAYYVASGFIGTAAIMGLITMAIAADYKRDLDVAFPPTVGAGLQQPTTTLKYGFVLPLIAWIIQIPAAIVFAFTPK